MALTVPLTPARRAILALGVPVTLGLIALGVAAWGHVAAKQLVNGDQVGHSVKLSAPVIAGQSRLTVDDADITLRPGSAGRIHVKGSLYGSIARPVFRHRLTPSGLTLDPFCRVHVGTCYLTLDVSVPAGLPVTASDNFGNLDVAGLHGRITLTDNNGDLTATRLTGTIHLDDPFGSLNATGLAGSVQLSANNGDITARGVTGDTRLRDSFANITVTGLAGAGVSASDTDGDIYLSFSQVPRRVTVTNNFGNITLVLPRGPATYQVHAARPLFGSRSVTVPESAQSPNVITAHDSNGDITIMNR